MNFNQITSAHPARWRRRFFVSASFGLLLLLLLLPPNAGAGGAPTVLSFTNTTPIIIYTQDDNSFGVASPFPSTNQVPSLPGALQSVTVTLYGLTDPDTASIDLLLVGPSGQAVDLMDAAGSEPAGGATVTIADSGAALPGPGGTLTTGTYQPSGNPFPTYVPFPQAVTTNVLAGFIGTPLGGTWSLYEYYDDYGGDGSISGGWSLTFTLVPAPPAVTNQAATNITSTNATLSATVNPNLSAATVYFQYGLTTNYGNFSATNTLASDLVDAQPVALPITGLLPGTTIHFQAVARNSAGTNLGGDSTFSTASGASSAPPVLVASLTNGATLVLTLYGNPGSNYTVVSATSLLSPITWTAFTNLTLASAAQVINPGPLTNSMEFFAVETNVTPPAPPVLVASLTNGASLVLTLSGNPGSSYAILLATNLLPPIHWTPFTNLTLTNAVQVINPGPLTNPMEFFRAAQQ